MDFFTVPTLTFGVLYCFFVIGHDRRKILRCNVTRNPNRLWVVQQLRETWPYEGTHRFLIFDRDSKFGNDVVSAVTMMSIKTLRTAFRSPWQNGVAERWVGSCRRDLLDHVIVLNERHLKRLMAEYVRYYHEDRTHLGLAKDASRSGNCLFCSWKQNPSFPATRRVAPSLRGSGLDRAMHNRKGAGRVVLLIIRVRRGSAEICRFSNPRFASEALAYRESGPNRKMENPIQTGRAL